MSSPDLLALAPFLARGPHNAMAGALRRLAHQLDPDRRAGGRRVVKVRVEYAATETEPPLLGPEYVYDVPEKGY